jgi:exodeoxyribonuclease VII large subunit
LISGEISNLKIPSSGHAYFTLKDAKAQIAAVMFKGQWRNLSFKLENGVSIIAMGRVSVYEPRGTYQIILEYAEPQGFGALQLAFEQLKRKLASQGLFESAAKQPLPFLPNTIGLITSATGAVVRDMLHVMQKRFPNLKIEIMPVRVQGRDAEDDIARALALANRRGSCDVLIVARGGGSLEDLAPFNSELVARAIFASRIPVVSAIGHETDYTIADFVADVRAPTPSVAAEIILPKKTELMHRILELQHRCHRAVRHNVQERRREFLLVQRSLAHPRQRVQERQLRIDDLTRQLRYHFYSFLGERQKMVALAKWRIQRMSPENALVQAGSRLEKSTSTICFIMKKNFSQIREKWLTYQVKLELLNPTRLLEKGYSITRTLPDRKVVTNAETVDVGQELEVLLHKGALRVSVRKT